MTIADLTPTKEVIWGAIGTATALAMAGLGWLLVAGAQRAGDRRWVLRRERHADKNELAIRFGRIDLTLERLTEAVSAVAIANATQAEAMNGFMRSQAEMMETMREFAADIKGMATNMATTTEHVKSMDGYWDDMREKGAIRIIQSPR